MRKRLLIVLLSLCASCQSATIRRNVDKDDENLQNIIEEDKIDDGMTDFDESSLESEDPLIIPRLTRAQKWDMILASGQDPTLRKRNHRQTVHKSIRKSKRDLLLAPWRITHIVARRPPPVKKIEGPAIALPVDTCPKRFDAVTRGYNGRTYIFARDRVFQMWYEDDLPQKASYLISELFPGGPRSVTAALTNSRSGVTILIDNRMVYRFRWNKKHKRFQLARNTPQELPRNITITPQTAFEWTDGNQVILSGDHFVIYDAYWNIATFTGYTQKYFPHLPKDLLGIVHNGGGTLIMYTKRNSLKVYSTKKYRVVQEYPIKLNEYVGCLSS